MSEFSLLCADATLWDPTTRATWGSLDFCPMITWFQVCTITQTQLATLSQAGAWGEVEKPWWDMAFLMIVPSTNAGGWPSLWSSHHVGTSPSRPLMHSDGGTPETDAAGGQWPRLAMCICSHECHHVTCAPSDKGQISALVDVVWSINACRWLHQLQVLKLLQHGDSVVFPEGLNVEPKTLQFSFQELPLWNATTTDGPAQDLPPIEVILGGVDPKTANTTQVPLPSGHWTSMWHCHGSQPTPPGGLGTAAADFTHNLSPCLPA